MAQTSEQCFKPNTELSNAMTYDTPKTYKRHEVHVKTISNRSVRVTFKGVPISVPNEEILHLCKHYRELTNNNVQRQVIRLGNSTNHTIVNSTRIVEVKLHPVKSFKNFYWLSGPDPGDRGRRVTVLHPNQPSQ